MLEKMRWHGISYSNGFIPYFSLDHRIEWCLETRCEVRFQGILQNLANLTIREKIPTKKRPEGLSEIV